MQIAKKNQQFMIVVADVWAIVIVDVWAIVIVDDVWCLIVILDVLAFGAFCCEIAEWHTQDASTENSKETLKKKTKYFDTSFYVGYGNQFHNAPSHT